MAFGGALYVLDAFSLGGTGIQLQAQQDGTAPATATASTGWRVGTTATANYSAQLAGTRRLANTFATTVLPAATVTTQQAIVSNDRYTGTFLAGTWNLSASLIGNGATLSGTGRLRMRIFRSTDPTFQTNVVELTASPILFTSVSALTTSTAQTTTATWTPGAFAMAGEYLGFSCAWEIQTASASTSAGVVWRVNATASVIHPPGFSPLPVQWIGEVDSGGSFTGTFNCGPALWTNVAGDLLTCAIIWVGGASTTITSVTDTSGNTYVQAGATQAISGGTNHTPANVSIWYAKNVAAAAINTNTVTVHFSDSASVGDICVCSYRGLDTNAPLVTTQGNSNASGGTTATTTAFTASLPTGGVACAVYYLDQGTTGANAPYTTRFLPSDVLSLVSDHVLGTGLTIEAATAAETAGHYAAFVAVFAATVRLGSSSYVTPLPDGPAGKGRGIWFPLLEAYPPPVAGGHAYTASISESISGPTDSVSRSAAYARSVSESITGPSDSVARSQGVTRAISESVTGPSDAVARAAAYHRSVSESVTAPSDAVSRAFTASRAIAESVTGPTDALARSTVVARAISESVSTPTDSVAVTRGVARAISESITAPTDALTRSTITARSVTESITAPTDAVTRSTAAGRSLAESITGPTDSVSRSQGVARSILGKHHGAQRLPSAELLRLPSDRRIHHGAERQRGSPRRFRALPHRGRHRADRRHSAKPGRGAGHC